jgi:hypothetical protein
VGGDQDYLDRMGMRYPKNYQLWWHRRLVVEQLGAKVVDRELEVRGSTLDEARGLYRDMLMRDIALGGRAQFTAETLQDDSKNYHVWCYRQWLVRTHGKSSASQPLAKRVRQASPEK